MTVKEGHAGRRERGGDAEPRQLDGVLVADARPRGRLLQGRVHRAGRRDERVQGQVRVRGQGAPAVRDQGAAGLEPGLPARDPARTHHRRRALRQQLHHAGAGLPAGRLAHRHPRRGRHVAADASPSSRAATATGYTPAPSRPSRPCWPRSTPAATLPTVPVTAGWNLLGVLDIFQNKPQATPRATKATTATRLTTTSAVSTWKVAYTYDTTKSLWDQVHAGRHRHDGRPSRGPVPEIAERQRLLGLVAHPQPPSSPNPTLRV